MTNENAYKLGFWDAYFMGSPDTCTDGWPDSAYDLYRLGYADGITQYVNDHKEAA
jgi:hypothetical protein